MDVDESPLATVAEVAEIFERLHIAYTSADLIDVTALLARARRER